MTYLTDELRGIDSAINELKKTVESLNKSLAEVRAEIDMMRKAMLTKKASEKQKKLIADICKTLNIPLPPRFYSDLSSVEASQFISEKLPFFYDAKRKEGVRTTA